MQPKAGLFLYSSPTLDDFFAGAVIYLSEYNASGAVGYIINRAFGRSLHELEEFKHSPHVALYRGGPVEKEHLFFVHRRPDLIDEGTPVSEGVYFGGNFRQALKAISNGNLSTKDIKLFVGYCGWNAGELEAEIAEGSWEVRKGSVDLIFDSAEEVA